LNITAGQIASSLAAILAFVLVAFCPGYVVGWLTDLLSFRKRSIIERIFWSIPLSVVVSTITAVLIGKFLSLGAVAAFFLTSAATCLLVIFIESTRLRHAKRSWHIGFQPFGGIALVFAIAWVIIAILSLIDFQSHQQLFMSLTIYDHAARVNWTESILRTGVPPDNPLYLFRQSAPMRYYYFWNVLCAAVAKISRLPVRGVFIGSCVWGGFVLASLVGLYLKYCTAAGVQLRKQFVTAIGLLTVSGLNSSVIVWRVFQTHRGLPGPPQIWAVGQINSWYDSLLFVPHHIASMVCCMFAFLLAWITREEGGRKRPIIVTLIAFALASAFGLSIYVAFGFFLIMLMWGIWQITFERRPMPALLLGAGGIGATVLLVPYLWELRHGASSMHGGSMFGFAVRETFSPNSLVGFHIFQQLSGGHRWIALSLAKLFLIIPGIAIELGFFFVVLLIFFVPGWRGGKPLTSAQRTLIFISVSTILLSSFVRSNVLDINDFGIRTALLLQFAALLLGVQLLSSWKSIDQTQRIDKVEALSSLSTPRWVRFAARLVLVLGVVTTFHQAIIFRFTVPIAYAVARQHPVADPVPGNLPHHALISTAGYSKLDAAIPRNAVVQANPADINPFWSDVDLVAINHQTAITSDKPWCGSELGGDPSGCSIMAARIDALFSGANAEQARATCREFGSHYLVARIYDPAWQDKQSWVWKLKPAVANEEFRALNCAR